MATFKKNKSGGSQSEGGSNSASPASSVALSNAGSTQGINNNAPKYGTLVPNRIFVGGISSNTTEAELSQLFSKYGCVKATKIIADRAGVSKGYGFVTFETEEEVKLLLQDSNNIVFKERRLNVAPAVKKQPSGRYDSSSPPPTTTPILHFANGVPYTYHNGMAFFPPTAHQPSLAALPPSADHSMYPSYSPAPNTAPAPYGTSVIVPGPPFLMPQNYSYQPLSMTNGAATQFIYPGSGSPSSSSGSPMANTPESHHPVPSVLSQQFFAPQFTPQEAFYPPYYIYSSSASVYTDYELQDQQTNDMMPQIQPQHFERPTYVMAANSAPRWSNVPQNSMKRISGNKKHNGSNSNLGGNNAVRSTKKIQGEVVEQDVGGGGDAQLAMNRNSPSPAGGNNAELTSKMQALALETSS